ncbi:MAG: AmmeMemoRadiSam system protein B [Verrucomicrobia bacterium]|nr:AmmeMemoRadiSam system protein B [Verrucomicrobiota bacterium]
MKEYSRYLTGSILLAALCLGACTRAGEIEAPSVETAPPAKSVFTSWLAGSWYPEDPEQLRSDIEGYIAGVPGVKEGHVQALIQPHAGYRYSGSVAAYGVKQIMGQSCRRVIVMGPTHRLPMRNEVSIPSATHYKTPLGEVPLDLECIEKLRAFDFVRNIPEAHSSEHSVQIQVPLLQVGLRDFKLVPIVVGQVDVEGARRIAEALLSVVDDDTLVVASTDFTHYGPNYGYVPFTDNVEQNLRALDMAAFDQIAKKDATGFQDLCNRTGATICGRAPVSILLSMLSEESRVELLKYDTSGDMTGDFGNSVSYISAAVMGTWTKTDKVDSERERLSSEDKEALLKLARKTIEYAFEHNKQPDPEALGIQISPRLRPYSGAFVTLNKKGRLRGCIGDIFPARPLYEAVSGNAINSAFNDRRFPPLTKDEHADVEIEISVLTPPERVDSYKDIVIGKHGMVINKFGRRAVYLPQVAPEQGWDIEETLTHLSEKAGLRPDAWKEGATFEVFEAIVFREGHE